MKKIFSFKPLVVLSLLLVSTISAIIFYSKLFYVATLYIWSAQAQAFMTAIPLLPIIWMLLSGVMGMLYLARGKNNKFIA